MISNVGQVRGRDFAPPPVTFPNPDKLTTDKPNRESVPPFQALVDPPCGNNCGEMGPVPVPRPFPPFEKMSLMTDPPLSKTDESDYDGGFITFVSDSTGVNYNVPDSVETDPDFLRAERLFFNSPMQQAYSGMVYDALQQVRTECSADYQTLCAPTAISIPDFETLLPLFNSLINTDTKMPLLWGRKLSSSSSSSSEEQVSPFWPKMTLNAFSRAFDVSSKSVSRRLHESDHHGNDHDDHHHGNDHDDHHHPGPRHDPHHGPHHDHDRPDIFFAGALGFGAAGDSCIYSQLGEVSTPCAHSVQRLHMLRDQYVRDDTQQREGHHHPVVVIFVLGALLLGIVHRLRTREKRKQTHALLAGLNGDAELKALVESKLHIVVPQQQSKNCDVFERDNRSSLCRTLLKAVGVLVVSFALSISSLCITEFILRSSGLVDVDESTGEVEKEPSMFVVFLLLFLVASVQVLLLKTAWFFCRSRLGPVSASTVTATAPYESNGGSDSPNARVRPSVPPTVFYEVNSRPSLSQWLAHNPLRNVWRRPQTSNTNSEYAPLAGNDDIESTEMIAIGNTLYTSAPVNMHTGGTMVVSAKPVNSVQFV